MLFCIGMDGSGDSVFADLSKLPHLIIGGGDTKKRIKYLEMIVNSLESCDVVLLDSLSLLKKNNHLKVETSVIGCNEYINTICKEISIRYDLLAKKKVTCIDEYNRIFAGPEIIKPIAVIIPELSSLIKEKGVLDNILSICRIGKAVGVHLILANSNWVESNLLEEIKMNVVSRLSLKVATTQESLAILDFEGAEKLLENELLFESLDDISPKKYKVGFTF